MKKLFYSGLCLMWFSTAACAHFQELIPSEDVVTEGGPVTLDLIFTHPMDRGPTMDMEKPKRFGVKRGDKIIDLSSRLEERKIDGKRAWRAKDEITEPGASLYFVEPQPIGSQRKRNTSSIMPRFWWMALPLARIGIPWSACRSR